jgi:hypothetical protein
MEEIIYSNVQSKIPTPFYVVCSVRTAINSRVAAGSNYEIVDWTDTVVALPYVIRTTSGANPTRYWAVDIMAGGYATSAEAQAWIDVNGNGGMGSIECVPTGTEI